MRADSADPRPSDALTAPSISTMAREDLERMVPSRVPPFLIIVSVALDATSAVAARQIHGFVATMLMSSVLVTSAWY